MTEEISLPADSPTLDDAIVLTVVSYDGAALKVCWQAVIPPGTSFEVTLQDSGGGSFTQPATQSCTTIERQLDPNLTYTVFVQEIIQGFPGPKSDVRTVITAKLTLNHVDFSSVQPGPNLSAALLQPAAPGIWGALVTFLDQNGTFVENQKTSTGQAQFSLTPQENDIYFINARAISEDTVVAGPPTETRTVITLTPVLNRVAFAGAQATPPNLAADVQPLTGPGIEGILVTFADQNGTIVENKITTTGQALFTLIPETNDTYFIGARATSADGVVLGPAAPTRTVITATPAMTLVAFDDPALSPNLTATWQPVTGPGIWGVLATLFDKDGSFTRNVSSNTGQAQFTLAPQQNDEYFVIAQAESEDEVVVGPETQPVTVLLSQPSKVALYFNGTGLPANWAPDTNPVVKSYIAQLFINGTAQTPTPVPNPPFTFPGPLAAVTTYGVRVRSAGDLVQGPWTAVSPGPYSVSLTLDYDPLGRLKTITRSDGFLLQYGTDDAGNLGTVGYSRTTAVLDREDGPE